MIVTQLFSASRGSVLLPASFDFQRINPRWPDAQPYDTPVFLAAARLVVWFDREAMLNRGCGVTEVIPQAANRLPHRAALSTRPWFDVVGHPLQGIEPWSRAGNFRFLHSPPLRGL